MSQGDPSKAPRDVFPWEKSYPADVSWNADLPLQTMVEVFDQSVRKNKNKPCITFMGKTYTYGEIGKMADKFAKGLQKDGYGKGTRVGICMPNTPYYLAAYYGAMKAGATVVNFNPLYSAEEMTHLIKDSGAEVMVTVNLKQVQSKLEAMVGKTPLKKVVSCDFAAALPAREAGQLRALSVAIKAANNPLGRASGLYKKLCSVRDKKGAPELSDMRKGKTVVPFTAMQKDGALAKTNITPDDIAVLQFTGGTTGLPKAAMLSHGNLAANTQQAGLWFNAGRKDGASQKVMTVLPFFHVFSMTVQMNLSIHMGDQILLNKPGERVDLTYLLGLIHDEKPQVFAGVPDLYKKILAHREDLLKKDSAAKVDLTSLTTCVSGAAPLPQQTWDAWKATTGVEIVEGYGLSETSPLVMANPIGGKKKVNSIGVPVPLTEVRIMNLDLPDQSVPIKVEGEICLRGPQVMKGYWKKDDETANVMNKDGFFRTGDVGYIDEDGYVFITDRIKDMVIVNGFKAFPRHIEEAIMTHPAVSEVIAMGIKDEDKGEAVKAFIVLKPDQKVTAQEMNAFLKDKLVHYALPKPKNIEFRAELPKTMIGKPDRKALKAEEKAKAEQKAAGPKVA